MANRTWRLLAVAVGVAAPVSVAEPPHRRTAEPPIVVKAWVLNFNPTVPAKGARLHTVCGWHDPRQLAKEYADDVRAASGGFIDYRIVGWRDIDSFPAKVDGFRYTLDQYLAIHAKGNGWHNPDGLDYPRLIEEYKLGPTIDERRADEVWLIGPPYSGFYESAMAGPGAFTINGGVFDKVPVRRPFALMGFNYERGVAEMLHDLCHRTESTMARVYGGWKSDALTTNWARFAANFAKSRGRAGVGDCHHPPNARCDYDYDNPAEVASDADDWLNYPILTGKTKLVSCKTWGGPDYHRQYLKWWFQRLPAKFEFRTFR